MRGCLGLLLLLPFVGASWLAFTVVDACIKRGGTTRLLGVLVSLVLGGVCIGIGYFLAYEGYTEWRGLEHYQVTYPVAGWIGMVIGGSVIIGGTLRALVATKGDIEKEELEKEQEKEWKEFEQEWAKEEAKKTLEQGEIDDYERLDKICNILDRIGFDTEAAALSQSLKELKKKQVKRQKGNP